ncbi:MAG: alpha/beta hydrolase [Gammaproteobacteria bacterium]
MNQAHWLLLLVVFASGCASTGASRFQPVSDYQMLDIHKNVSYEQYQQQVTKALEQNWTELSMPDADYPWLGRSQVHELVEAHTPTNNKAKGCKSGQQKPRAMLLVHGLYDSPRVMRDLEEYFNNRCFHTRSILLPGHGTRPGSLLNISYQAWNSVVEHAIEQFSKENKGDIYITGFSTGGALAIKNALDHKDKVKGVFLFAPALKVKYGLASMLDKLGMDWVPFQIFGDTDLIKYESMTLDSVIAVGKLADEVRTRLNNENTQIDIPVMLVIAKNDYTIKTDTAIQLYEQGKFGNKSDMLIYAPIMVGDKCVKGLLQGDAASMPKIPTYMSSCFVHREAGNEYMIADYSHMALSLKSTDAHYGLQGDYKYCTQYFHNEELETQCKCKGNSISDICFGERKVFGSHEYPQCNKPGLIVRRLTSNPQFQQMIQYLDQFIRRYIDKNI